MNPTKKLFLLLRDFMNSIRKLRFKHKSKKLLNKDVTILYNTCLAGVIYSTLSLKFLSPTIDLEIYPESFVSYAKYYESYKTGSFIKRNNRLGYYFGPNAYLRNEGLPDLDIVFTHYREVDQAAKKWKEREKRINPNKIFILYEARYDYQIDSIDKVNELPYPKVILSSLPSDPKRNIVHMDYFITHPNKPITSFKGILGKRAIDDFDYINTIFNRNYKNHCIINI